MNRPSYLLSCRASQLESWFVCLPVLLSAAAACCCSKSLPALRFFAGLTVVGWPGVRLQMRRRSAAPGKPARELSESADEICRHQSCCRRQNWFAFFPFGLHPLVPLFQSQFNLQQMPVALTSRGSC